MTMLSSTYFLLVAAFAAVCGGLVARVISYETRGSLPAVFAGAYTGAGAGLAGGPPFAFILTLVTGSWSGEGGLAIVSNAIESTSLALFWGLIGGAAGGFVIGMLVALFKLIRP